MSQFVKSSSKQSFEIEKYHITIESMNQPSAEAIKKVNLKVNEVMSNLLAKEKSH
ncbi:hypothetical protein [Bacillus sp. FCW2]|uniref:hypothetical protein n=1 Tax=Bacillus sp. FCW2 TaxID=2867004 RepID=UPI001E2E37C0|nr:hypothetical protein [Bacillus sp. FCW2]UHC66582.1 hypothetical protein K3G25_08270 [Bacillus sp. FCW2]